MLDVYIFGPGAFCTTAPAKSFVRRDAEYVCSFHNEGYYWFLFQILEDLAKQTGRQIDLSGIRMKPLPVVEVRSEVDKQRMTAWLETLKAEVHKAKLAGKYVVFYGD